MIDLAINNDIRDKNAAYCREKGILLPTFEMMKNPEKVPAKIREALTSVGLWEVNPLNLFRITWKNEQKESGGLYGGVNHFVLPPELTVAKPRLSCCPANGSPPVRIRSARPTAA